MWQRILACFDKAVTAIFGLSSSGSVPGWEGAASEWHYFLMGPRCAIIRADGSMEIGGIFEVVHRNDERGKLLLRRSRWRTRRLPGDRFIFGDRRVQEAYRHSPNYMVNVGGFEF